MPADPYGDLTRFIENNNTCTHNSSASTTTLFGGAGGGGGSNIGGHSGSGGSISNCSNIGSSRGGAGSADGTAAVSCYEASRRHIGGGNAAVTGHSSGAGPSQQHCLEQQHGRRLDVDNVTCTASRLPPGDAGIGGAIVPSTYFDSCDEPIPDAAGGVGCDGSVLFHSDGGGEASLRSAADDDQILSLDKLLQQGHQLQSTQRDHSQLQLQQPQHHHHRHHHQDHDQQYQLDASSAFSDLTGDPAHALALALRPETTNTVRVFQEDEFITRDAADERFCCSLCEHRTSSRSRCREHVRTHTGVKPYQCALCGRCFNKRECRDNHVRSRHTLEKPYRCQLCPKSYPSSAALAVHRKACRLRHGFRHRDLPS